MDTIPSIRNAPPASMVPADTGRDSVVVLNPESGTGTHGSTVRRLAAAEGYAVRESRWPGHP
ncbi:MAG: hypothetical protein ACOCP2_01750, partial [Halohasta sp.]